MSSSSAGDGGGGDGGGWSSRPVHAYFRRLNLNANERWAEASIAEVRRANAAGMSAIIKSCYERWIGCDISTDDVQVRKIEDAVGGVQEVIVQKFVLCTAHCASP